MPQTYFKLEPTDFYGYSLSGFAGAQTGENALFCQTIVSDDTIIASFEEFLQDRCDVERIVRSFCENKFSQVPLAKNGFVTGDLIDENLARFFRVFGEFVRCVVNDVVYATLICKAPKLIDLKAMTDEKADIVRDYTDISRLYNRVSKSMRETVEYFAKDGWVEIDAVGKVEFKNPEVRGMIQGIFRVFVMQMLSGFSYTDEIGRILFKNADPTQKNGSISPKHMAKSANVIVEAMVAIYGNNVPEDGDAEESVIVVKAAKIINMLMGSPSTEKKLVGLVAKIVKIASSRIATAKGITKALAAGDVGSSTSKTHGTEDMRKLKRNDFVKLGNSTTRPSIMRSKLDGTMTAPTRMTKKPVGRGKIYALIDCSGSTLYGGDAFDGELNLAMIFETIALSVVQSARLAGVDASIAFYGEKILHIAEFNHKDNEMVHRQNCYELVGHGGNYENAEGQAFEHILNLMAIEYRIKRQPQTLFFLTDGRILTSRGMTAGQLADRLRQIGTENPELRVLPMIVYPTVDSNFFTAFRTFQFIHVPTAEAFGAAHIEDIMRFTASLPASEIASNPYNTIQEL